ncbi:MAG: hypothetical protein ABUR63_00590 [Verrucomicrobiota bacterium]
MTDQPPQGHPGGHSSGSQGQGQSSLVAMPGMAVVIVGMVFSCWFRATSCGPISC